MVERTSVRFIIVGTCLYITDFSMYYTLVKFNTNPLWANFYGKISGAFVGFFLHRMFTFRVANKRLFWRHALKYAIVNLLYAPFSSFILKMVISLNGHIVVSRVISDIICILISYFVARFVVFNKESRDSTSTKILH